MKINNQAAAAISMKEKLAKMAKSMAYGVS